MRKVSGYVAYGPGSEKGITLNVKGGTVLKYVEYWCVFAATPAAGSVKK